MKKTTIIHFLIFLLSFSGISYAESFPELEKSIKGPEEKD
jgi:hypothetical protein